MKSGECPKGDRGDQSFWVRIAGSLREISYGKNLLMRQKIVEIVWEPGKARAVYERINKQERDPWI